jgi:membrane protease YdiL (CAAX protease family)
MIHRLLRGRALYLALGLLLLGLYAPLLSRPAFQTSATERHQKARIDVPDEGRWWPKGLDPAAFLRTMKRHPRLASTLTALSLLTVGMGFGGLIISAWAIGSGRVRTIWTLPRASLPAWSVGELVRVLALTLLIAGLLPFVHTALVAAGTLPAEDHRLWMTVSMLLLDSFVILSIWAFASGKGGAARRLGLSTRSIPASVGTGLRGYVTAFPWIFLALFLVAETALRLGWRPPVEPIQELVFIEQRPEVLGLTVVLACVVGPLAEELFFRGLVYPVVRRKLSPVMAMVVSGAAFAALHTNLVGFLPILLLGCLLAYLYERTGSLVAPLSVHILHNTLLMSLALTVKQVVALSPTP